MLQLTLLIVASNDGRRSMGLFSKRKIESCPGMEVCECEIHVSEPLREEIIFYNTGDFQQAVERPLLHIVT